MIKRAKFRQLKIGGKYVKIENEYANDRPLGRVVKGESGVQSHSDLDGVGSIPAIPNARYVPSALCHERYNEARLPEYANDT